MTTTAAKYYALADANGPITVRIEADSASEARQWFRDHQNDGFVDDCRTDAEDDLGVCGEGMNYNEWSAVMESKGYEIVDSDMCGDFNWALWARTE